MSENMAAARRPGSKPGYGLFVAVVGFGYVVFSGMSLVGSLKAHSRQAGLGSASASESASSMSAPSSKPTQALSTPPVDSAPDAGGGIGDQCLKQVKASDWDGAKKTCQSGADEGKDAKVTRACYFGLGAIARHEKDLSRASKAYFAALTYEYDDDVRDALSQVSTWKATEKHEDTTVIGKKTAKATLFKQPGTHSEKVKSLDFGTAVHTTACVSSGKETWCAVALDDQSRGWIAQSRLAFSKEK